MRTLFLTDAAHRRALSLVRRMELVDSEWSELLEALEIDKPLRGVRLRCAIHFFDDTRSVVTGAGKGER